jgi:hypothetical protein
MLSGAVRTGMRESGHMENGVDSPCQSAQRTGVCKVARHKLQSGNGGVEACLPAETTHPEAASDECFRQMRADETRAPADKTACWHADSIAGSETAGLRKNTIIFVKYFEINQIHCNFPRVAGYVRGL